MSRRTLTITAAAVTVFLAMAVASASASAAGFVSGTEIGYVKGTGTQDFILTTSFGTMDCGNPAVEGKLTGPSEALTTSVNGSTCGIFGEAAPMGWNGCGLTFHPAEDLSGTVDIGPANCGPITIVSKVYGTFKVYPKTGMKTVSFTNEGSGSTATVRASLSLTGVKYQLPGGEVKENGTISAGWSLAAFSDQAHTHQVSLKAVSKLPDGFYVTGAGGESGNLPRFSAESFPVTVTGNQTTQPVFTTAGGMIRCKTTLHGEMSSAAGEIHLGLQLENCVIFGLSGTVNTNLCEYVLNVAYSGTPYTGTLVLSCANPGEGLEFTATGLCTQKIPAQTLGSVTYENVGSGYERKVNVSVNGSSLQYSGSCGSGSNGTYKGSWSLEGGH